MIKKLTCILCPNGCGIEVKLDGTKIISVSGNGCKRGAGYAEQEIKNSVRNIASSVLVEGGDMPLCSVRLSEPVPKERIFDVMEEISRVRVFAPVSEGDVIIKDVLGLKSDVIATRNVEKL
jgi:CxxC motif-containing protein